MFCCPGCPAVDVPWMVNDTEAGVTRTSHGFTFLRVREAGHLVPRDQPAHALHMVNLFTAGTLHV